MKIKLVLLYDDETWESTILDQQERIEGKEDTDLENRIRILNREIKNLRELNKKMSKCVDDTLKDYKLQIKENIKLKKILDQK